MNKKRQGSFFRKLTLFLGGLILLLLCSCHSHKDILDTRSADTLIVGVSDISINLDWNRADDFSSGIVLSNIMEGLTSFDISGSEVRVLPALALQWDVGDRGTQYVFKLRPNVKWSDGRVLTAGDFVASFRRVLAPATASPWCDFLYAIKNARDFHEGRIKNFADVGIKATNDLTLIFNLTSPVTYFPELLAHHSTFPIRQDLLEKFKEHWSEPQNLVTLGPYKLGHIENLKYILIERYKDYYGNKSLITNILLRFNVTPGLGSELFRTGRLDVMTDLPPNPPKELRKKRELLSSMLMGITFLSFDVTQKPVNNPIFRRAVGMAIDHDELLRTTNTPGRTVGGMIPPGLIGYESNRGVRFDPDTAKKLLQHSGYHDLQKWSFLLRVAPRSQIEALAYNIQSQLKRNLDLDVKVVTDQPLSQKSPSGVPVMYLSKWQATIPEPDNFLRLFAGGSGFNITHWRNRNYDEYLRQGAAVIATDQREKIYSKAQHILTEEEMPVVPLFVNIQTVLVHKRLRGFPLNALRLMPFKGVLLEKD